MALLPTSRSRRKPSRERQGRMPGASRGDPAPCSRGQLSWRVLFLIAHPSVPFGRFGPKSPCLATPKRRRASQVSLAPAVSRRSEGSRVRISTPCCADTLVPPFRDALPGEEVSESLLPPGRLHQQPLHHADESGEVHRQCACGTAYRRLAKVLMHGDSRECGKFWELYAASAAHECGGCVEPPPLWINVWNLWRPRRPEGPPPHPRPPPRGPPQASGTASPRCAAPTRPRAA